MSNFTEEALEVHIKTYENNVSFAFSSMLEFQISFIYYFLLLNHLQKKPFNEVL